MLVQRSLSLRAFAGDWETWCDNKFPADPGNLQKCRAQPFGPLTLAPWTDVGAIQRGIPKPESLIVNAVQGGGVAPASGSGDTGGMAQASMFSSSTMLIGGAVLAGGLGLAYYLKFKKRGSRRGRR